MVSKYKREAYQNFARRLLDACEHDTLMPKKNERGFTKALGMKVGIGYKGAEKWIKGESMPDMGNATILAKSLGVSLEWLMTGRGSKTGILGTQEEAAEYRIPREHFELAKDIALLSPKTRDSIKHLVDIIQRKGEEK